MSRRGSNFTKQIMGGGPYGRARFGVTVTFENSKGELRTIYKWGAPREALVAACENALRLDPTNLVVSYSNPQTIYVDIQGGRSDFFDQNGTNNATTRPEFVALSYAGLSHLCHPRLKAISRSVDRRVAVENR